MAAEATDETLLGLVEDQLEEPATFREGVRSLAAPERVTFDVLRFKDGRVFERCSRPQLLGDEIVGRAWSFHDVTERDRGLHRARTDGQLGLQLPASPIMQEISDLFNVVNIVIIVIALFVLVLMVWVIYRYSEKNNPTPSRITHHTGLEVAWTILPILILVGISIPSFHLLFNQYSFPKPDLTIKATGNAWFWEHEYLDQKVTVTSNIVNDEDVLRAKIGDDAYDKKYGSLEGAALHNALYPGLAADMGGEPPAAAPDGRSGNRRADQQGRARAGHVERRHSLLDGSVVGREDAGRSGPHVGSLVQGHEARHVPRSMLGFMR